MGRILRCVGLFGVLALVSFIQVVPAEAETCSVHKWYQACSSTSEQQCQAACGSCSMCLNIVQFNPCVYECRCAC
jgi:hypothetical protein